MYNLSIPKTALIVIDIQDRLIGAMDSKIYDAAKENVIRMVKGANILNIPVHMTQQYTKGLGSTVNEIGSLINTPHIEKLTFSCCGEPSFIEILEKDDIKNVVVCGMETHICVLQTVIDLLNHDFNVHVLKDAVVSRKKINWETGLDFMKTAGAIITVTETVLFQLLKKSGTQEFKEISKIIK